MAWICLVELEGLRLHCKNGSVLLPIVKLTPIVKESLQVECPNVSCLSRQSGTMCEHSQHPFYQKKLTSFMEASHAKTFQLQAAAKAWKESEADYFTKSCGWPKKSSPRSYSLKTSLELGQKGLIPLSGNWPISGMIVDGSLYPLRKSERTIKEKDGGFLPTPTRRSPPDCPAERKRHSPSLEAIVNMFPTPTARDWKDNGLSPAELTRNSITLATKAGGKLNPAWVEWLMGYPFEWTELKDSVMPLFQRKRKKLL